MQQDYEKLGVFYLGKEYDPVKKQDKPNYILYDSKDLVTHAVCVGMTGSGKTGLCLALLEEAAIDDIPALVIDPKGDLSNLLLTFPDLRGKDFEPWVNVEDARKAGLSTTDFAQKQADLWKKGLALWDEPPERIKMLREKADFVIYTPGSNAGIPVSILQSFEAPPEALRDDTELLRERVNTTATSLLGLLDIEADPIQSKEHILVSTILSAAWKAGKDMDLASLISQIQTPPVTRIGVLDLETFFPAKERFALAMQFNNLLASPSFESWMEGVPLDIASMLHTPSGKPRIAIFSIAHLNDTERMFFVSLFYNQVLGWMRQQPGTTSLRALIYMDEIFGYFPPVKNPPSKMPMLTMLKQARAFGVGMVLATQNPVDIDYKGLANCGTWFIGRLQTERDKLRLLDGLEGAAAATGSKFDRGQMNETLASLGNRIFLLHNVHEDHPVVFESRWALCYLRGPLTRQQIKMLMDPRRPEFASQVATPEKKAVAEAGDEEHSDSRAVLPPTVTQLFIPKRGSAVEGGSLVYKAQLLGSGQVYYNDKKADVDLNVDYTFLAEITDDAVAVTWDDATLVELADTDLEKDAEAGSLFASLPREAAKPKNYDAWKKAFADFLFRNQKITVYKSDDLDQVSKPNEKERDFRVRLQQSAREERDRAAEQLRQKFAPRIASIDERIRKATVQVENKKSTSLMSKLTAAVSVGVSMLDAFLSRKTLSVTNINKAATAARGASRAMKTSRDVSVAEDNVEALVKQKEDLQADFDAETKKLEAKADPLTMPLSEVQIRPKKTNINVRVLALTWVPWWKGKDGKMVSAWMS
jgi:hypothetical protein